MVCYPFEFDLNRDCWNAKGGKKARKERIMEVPPNRSVCVGELILSPFHIPFDHFRSVCDINEFLDHTAK